MKKSVVGVVFLAGVLLIAPFIIASFQAGNPDYFVDSQYSPGGNLTGWINVSLDDEPADSVIEIDGGDSISLIDLIQINIDEPSCIPTNCESDFAVNGSGATSKEITLSQGESKVLGFRVVGSSFNSIGNFAFDIVSNAGVSDFPQLYVDVLNDKEIEWQPTVASGSFSDTKDYGCYSNPQNPVVGTLGSNAYCNIVEISPTPNMKIGAELTGSGTANFIIDITDQQKGISGECEFDDAAGEYACVPQTSSGNNFTVSEESKFLVCIRKESGEGAYNLNYALDETCRGTSDPNFALYAKRGEYNNVDSTTINNVEIEKVKGSGTNIESEITTYLDTVYNGDCSDGCIIPLNISSRTNQDITISGINIVYEIYQATTPVTSTTNEIYEVTETPARISTTGYEKLQLDKAGLNVPTEIGNHTIRLNFISGSESSELFEENILVKKIPRVEAVSPTVVPAAYSQTFKVQVQDFGTEITEYKWDFYNDGDEVETTDDNEASFVYSNIGDYSMKITVENNEGLSSSRVFEISVASPEQAVNTVFTRAKSNFEDLADSMDLYTEFQQRAIKRALDFSNLESELSDIEQQKSTAASDQDFVDIMKTLSGLEVSIPSEIYQSGIGSELVFYPYEDYIDVDALAQITGEEYDSGRKDEYVNAVIAWNLGNTQPRVNYQKYSGVYSDYNKEFVGLFEIKVNENSERGTSYLVIPKLENLEFKQSYSQEEVGDYYYIELDEDAASVEFFTTQEVSFEEFPAFISPSIENLALVDLSDVDEANFFEKLIEYKWTLFILVIILLVGIAGMAYFLIGKWYQKKYEDYLFPNKNDFYNLINYINIAKKRKVPNREIEKNLRKSNWTSEQIKYVMRKYAGKRTGLPGIPELAKKKRELEKKRR